MQKICIVNKLSNVNMLTHLHIRNYALISHLDIDFHEGFSVMTGETGAGKSIILGALNLVMGARADTKTITEGEERCVIEATFAEAKGDEAIRQEIIIRRELNTNGRSRSFVNDEVVTQAELKELARQLIDIHSQHESLMLSDDLFQLQIVDTIANNQVEQAAYSAAYEQYTQAQQQLYQFQQRAAKAQADADYTAFQWQQLEDAHLQPDEMAELEDAILTGKDLRSTETLASHAQWAEDFIKKHGDVNKENVTDIIREEIGLVFSEVLENAGVYKCTEEGREYFLRFIQTVD